MQSLINNREEMVMKFKRTDLCVFVAGAMLAMSGTAAASGFALIEQSGSGLGNAYAGGAAGAEDASTIFFNPAGMSRLNGKQVVVAGNFIKPSAKFTGTGLPGTDMGGDAGSLALVPNAYFAIEINPAMRVGLGINAPFGLQTEYDPLWVGRVHAIKSKIETVNLNPSVAYQVNDALSIGAGVNYQRINGELTSFAGVPGTSTVKGNDSAWGYNFGALYNISPQTRLGFSYRSAIDYTLTGDVAFSAAPAGNGPVTLAIKMPDSFSFSAFHKLDEKWDVMGDLSRTGWGTFQQLNVVRTTGATLMSVQENWKETWRISIGANHHYSEQWTSRVGLAYDQAPVSDAFRTARIPDNDRIWLALGGQYKPSKESAIDFGYAHLFVKDASINSTAAAPALVGTYKNSVDILSVQYTYSF
ncbi:MAG TPA: outer membrane protein transport protein [Gallionella sp.]